MKFSDLRPGDHVVWKAKYPSKQHEIFIVSVDAANCCWTHLTLVDEHRPENVGELYTTPATEAARGLWDCEGDGEIVSRLT